MLYEWHNQQINRQTNKHVHNHIYNIYQVGDVIVSIWLKTTITIK